MSETTINNYNNLSNATSPYLLQHASNPVDWYPWCEEAFKKAKDEDKMVFLSVGYSTCHWCHVMAHESFESREVADILSSDYIAIKVDREERPDIDEVYMSVCQTLTGSGGWPLTVIMTADKKPFFAGTYFPKTTKHGHTGLIELLNQISNLWHNERKTLLNQGEKIVDYLQPSANRLQQSSNEQIINNAYLSLQKSFDSEYGGFSYRPKFPSPHNLLFLLRYYKKIGDNDALNMVQKNLYSMYKGGIFDHVGYGFSRYSTDNMWLVPHFEKMLYDNALLIMAYSEAYAITNDNLYKDVVEKTIDYLMTDMKASGGAFYSAQDADSEGVEGKYYVFSYKELDDLLNKDELEFLEMHYNVSKKGNFEENNILNRIKTDANIDKSMESKVIKKLYKYRSKRVPPFLDTKILSSWNGLMVAALSMAGRFIDKRYISDAKKTTDFIIKNMMDKDLMLCTSYKDGKHSDQGFMPDYANVVWGLIELYKVSLDMKYLNLSINLTKKMITRFWDEGENKFFMNEKESFDLPLRPKDEYDGAMPSGNSVAISNLIKLYNYTHDEKIHDILDKAIKSFAHNAESSPGAYMHYNATLLSYTQPHRQVIITGKNLENLYQKIVSSYLPFTTVIVYDGNESQKDIMPDLNNYLVDDKRMIAYVCEDFTCTNPIYDERELLEKLSLKLLFN